MSTQEQGITIDGLPSLGQFSPEAIIYVVLNDQDFHIKFDTLRQFLVDNLPTVEIPEGLSTVEDMQAYVDDLFANEDFAEKVVTVFRDNKASLLDGFINSENLELNLGQQSIIQSFTQRIQALEQSDEDLVTTAQLQQAISEIEQPNLSAYATKEELEGLVGLTTKMGKVFFVNVNSNNTVENGSPEAPFKTIQAAIEAVPTASVIQLSPGSYREDITFVRDNILIQGYGCVGANIVEIVGTVTFGTEVNPNITRCRFKDVTLKNSAVDKPAMNFNNNLGRHYFDNVVVEPMAGTTVPALNFEGETKNWLVFRNCEIGGLIKFTNPSATPLTVYFENGGHTKMEILSEADVKIKMTGTNKGKKITLNNGTIQARQISGFTGVDGVAVEINSQGQTSYITYSDFMDYEGNAPSIWYVGEGATLKEAYNLFDTSLDQGPGVTSSIIG